MATIRSSRKRDAIYAMLTSTKTHPTAEWIYAQLKPEIPDLSLGTVYRNLARFKEDGRAMSVATVSGQERFDGDTRPHAHFICRRCGAVLDIEGIEVPELANPALTVEGYQLNYYGVCRRCENNEKVKEN